MNNGRNRKSLSNQQWFYFLSVASFLVLSLMISNCTAYYPPVTNTPTKTLFGTAQQSNTKRHLTPTYDKTTPATPVPTNTTLPFTIEVESINIPELLEEQDTYPAIGILINKEPTTLAIFSPKTQYFKQTSFKDEDSVFSINNVWTSCEILISMSSQDRVRLSSYNLLTNSAEDLFVLQSEPTQYWKTYPEISPTGKWVSYAVWSGNYYYVGAEHQDLEVIPIENGLPQRLTSRGGAWMMGGAWSPKVDVIAFSDFDSDGVSQLFLKDLRNGQTEQVTSFTETGSRIEAISWSPVGDQFVYIRSLDRGEEITEVLWVVELSSKQSFPLALPVGVISIGDQIYWNNSGTAIVTSLVVSGEGKGMFWIDLKNKLVYHTLKSRLIEEMDVFNYSFEHPFPITQDLRYLGFLAYDTVYMFDSQTDIIYRLAKILDLQEGLVNDITPFTQDVGTCLE